MYPQSTITFMSGSNSTTLPIRVTDDDTIELSELAVVTLTEVVLNGNTDPDVSADLAAQIDPLTSSAAVTIQANDYPHGLLTFSGSSRSVTVDEPETGNITSVSLTVIREYGLIGMLYGGNSLIRHSFNRGIRPMIISEFDIKSK